MVKKLMSWRSSLSPRLLWISSLALSFLLTQSNLQAQEFLSCKAEPHFTSEAEQYHHVGKILRRLGGDDMRAFFGMNPKIQIVRSRQANAFSIKPSEIRISTALMEIMDNDNEIAFVIAHELGHLLSDSSSNHSASALFRADDVVEREIKADRIALRLMLDAGYDPLAADSLLERLAKLQPWLAPTEQQALRDRVTAIRISQKAQSERFQ